MRLTRFNQALRDMYPSPGERLKQYVVDMRREAAWENETCPKVDVEAHNDNTEGSCRNGGGRLSWTWLNHDSCDTCGALYESMRDREDVKAWLAERAKRPGICSDRERLSNQTAPDIGTFASPTLAMLRRR